MKQILMLMMVAMIVGCQVPVDARAEARLIQRLKEIDEAAARGDITELQRQELKNQLLRASLVIPADND